jgi:RHS repeat-associated protein
VVNDTTTYYPSTAYQEEVSGSGPKTYKYYSLGGQKIAMRTNGTLNWLVTDHLGSTNVATDSSGNLTSEIRYSAFGEVRSTNGTTATDYRYTGQLQQAEIGLDYYRARWYDAYLNQWTQPDNIVPDTYHMHGFMRMNTDISAHVAS